VNDWLADTTVEIDAGPSSCLTNRDKMRARRQLSDRELQEHFDEQLAFLEASSASFDAGFEGEAKRLAVTLRVLFHDSRTSKSLVGMLGKTDRQFFDTAIPVNSQSVVTHGGLVWVASGSSKTRYIARLDDVPVSLCFRVGLRAAPLLPAPPRIFVRASTCSFPSPRGRNSISSRPTSRFWPAI
jgi:hypothetical protein